MTQTTTELLSDIVVNLASSRQDNDMSVEYCIKACDGMEKLDEAMVRGEPLPNQWRVTGSEFDALQAEKRDLEKLLSNESTMCMRIVTERDALRLRISDRDVVEKWVFSCNARRVKLWSESSESLTRCVIKLYCPHDISFKAKYFHAPTPDEAYHLAAEWVRGQDV